MMDNNKAEEQTKKPGVREILFPKTISEFRVDLAQENYLSLKYLIFGGVILTGIALLIQIIFGSVGYYGHAIELLCFFGYSIPIFLAFRKDIEANATLVLYVWVCVLFGFETLMCTAFIPDQQAFTFLLLLLVLPLLIRDAPGKVLVLILAVSVFFMICTWGAKTPAIAYRDILHTLMCMACSAALSLRILKDRLGFMLKSNTASSNAQHDGLTGIYNRRGGEMLIRNYVRSGVTGSFILMDVDDFKHVNDTYGHAVGDEVLKKVAQTLQNNFRESDVVMRMGGDEFIVYAIGMADSRSVEHKLETVRLDMHKIMLDAGKNDFVTTSMGCVINLGSYPSYDSLSEVADLLLYKTKQNGKDGYTVSDRDYVGQAIKSAG